MPLFCMFQVFKITSERWWPPPATAIHRWRRFLKFSAAFWHVSSTGTASSLFRSLSSSEVRGRCLKTFSFRQPHKKKSQMLLKSGERAGHHLTSPLRETSCVGNVCRSFVIETRAVCAVLLSSSPVLLEPDRCPPYLFLPLALAIEVQKNCPTTWKTLRWPLPDTVCPFSSKK